MSAALLSCVLLLSAKDATDPDRLDDATLAERADAAFAEGVRLRSDADAARPCFRRAADYYEALRRRGVRNPALFRNLGNALLLADDLPGAILSYRRGLRLAPHDAELRACLAAARAQVMTPPAQPKEERPPLRTRVPPAWWFGGAALLYGLACVGVLRWRMTRRTQPLWFTVVWLGAAASLTVGGVEAVRVGRSDDRTLVVISEDGTVLRQGNGTAYPPRLDAKLNAGVEAVLLFERDGWLQIELANGVVGWVPAKDALIDRET
jgi:hypothetical protein